MKLTPITHSLVLFGMAQTCESASSLVLDFGSLSAPNFGSTETSIQYTGIAPGVNATLEVDGAFAAQTPANHGSVTGSHVGAEGDVRINMTSAVGNTDPNNIVNGGVFTLNLWDANTGDGFSTHFSSADSFEWTLNFYDIDAGTVNPNGFFTYDYLRLMTSGEYIVAAASSLGVQIHGDDSVSFSGASVGVVPGQDGLGLPFTTAQANATVQYVLTDQSSVTFEYAALRNGGNNLGPNGRNLLIDGGELSGVFDGVATIGGSVVPEPSTFAILLLSTLGVLSRRLR